MKSATNTLKAKADVLSGTAKAAAKITTGDAAQGSTHGTSPQNGGGLKLQIANVLPAGQGTNGAVNVLSGLTLGSGANGGLSVLSVGNAVTTPGGNKPIVQLGDSSSTSPILGLGVLNGATPNSLAPIAGLTLGDNTSKPLLNVGAIGEVPVLKGVTQTVGLQSALGGDLTVGMPDLKLNLPKLPKLIDLPDINIDLGIDIGVNVNVNVVDIDINNGGGGGGGGGGSVEIGGFVSVIDEDVLTRCIRVVRNPSRYAEREVRVCRLVIARVRREIEQRASAE
ncbi:MAG: hypothetical protein ACREMY_21495 [bacterium]